VSPAAGVKFRRGDESVASEFGDKQVGHCCLECSTNLGGAVL